MTGAALVRGALRDALGRDPAVRLLGEALDLSPATQGLRADFGDRVHLLPASDATLVGLAVGMALGGGRPVVDLAGPASLWGALQQLGQEAAAHAQQAEFPTPVVLRVPVPPGAEAPVAALLDLPGLTVAVASSGAEAAQQLEAALQSRGPVVLLQPLAALASPAEPVEALPLGRARLLRAGRDATLLAVGEGVAQALQAAATLAEQGIEVDVVDLRGLAPLDAALVGERVSNTGRVIALGAAAAALRVAVKGAFLRLESPPVAVDGGAPDPVAALVAAVSDSVNY